MIAIVTMVTVNVGRETNTPVNLMHHTDVKKRSSFSVNGT